MTIQEKKQLVEAAVIAHLQQAKMEHYGIFTIYEEEGELRDGTSKEVIITRFTEARFHQPFFVYADMETLALLFVYTGPGRYTTIEDFFS